ncbi:cyclo(L-leucyl-L-leucyl) synthase-like [Montipora capricornis]|uniref:cyclo(L-leucyl-L-leucyl) synthase-like n=1 Tax=Montipora foliosa TaxID=591990 RepID=UPI0035F17E0A
MSHSEISQAVLNGKKFLHDRKTLLLGISPGNPYYYRSDVLERLFDFAKQSADKVLVFIPDKILEHNFRAVGSKNPERSAHVKANRLRNKCDAAIKSSGFSEASYSYIRWMEEVETCPKYLEAYRRLQQLYQANEGFRTEISRSTEMALRCLQNGREKAVESSNKENEDGNALDLQEGEKYLLKELAFLEAVPNIYESCQEFVLVYHRSWPVLEKYMNGAYDDKVKPFLGFVILPL